MPITFSAAYLAELAKDNNISDVIVELHLDHKIIDSFDSSIFAGGGNSITGIAAAPDGTYWACRSNAPATIYNINNDGTTNSSFLASIIDAGLTSPSDIAFLSDGNLLISDLATKKVYKCQTDGTFISEFLFTAVSGGSISITAITEDPDGTYWLGDNFLDKIFNTSTSGITITSFPISSYSNSIRGMDYYKNEDILLIVDASDELIEVSKTGDKIKAIDLNALDSNITSPSGITIDIFDSIFVSDLGTNKIHRLKSVFKIGERPQFIDVTTALKNPSSNQNRIEAEKSKVTKGTFTFDITSRENFEALINDEYLMTRRVKKKEGFVGIDYDDYAETFTGTISNWSRKGDILKITVTDDQHPLTKRVPVENDDKTQYLDYSDWNPVDVIKDLDIIQAGVPAGQVNSNNFDSERDLWRPAWKVQRFLTNADKTEVHIAQLALEINAFHYHDGSQLNFEVFAPTPPGTAVKELTKANHLKDGVFINSGYSDHFFNRVIVYYNYDESGDDGEAHFDSALPIQDNNSIANWGRTVEKVIKCKWIKDYTFDQPINIPIVLYHVAYENGLSAGATGHQIAWNSTNSTLAWTAPDGIEGEAVKVEGNGRFDLFDSDKRKYVRVIVDDFASLPGSNQTDAISITSIGGSTFVSVLANSQINRFGDPAATVDFQIDLNDVSNDGEMWKPTDTFRLTSDDISVKGKSEFNAEPMMMLSVRPNHGSSGVNCSAIQTKLSKKGIFIAPNGFPDYEFATEEQREFFYIGRTSDNKVFDGTDYVGGAYII